MPRKSAPTLFDRIFGTGTKPRKTGPKFSDQIIETGRRAGGAAGRLGRSKPKKK